MNIIYQIRNLRNDKVYVGSSTNFYDRKISHSKNIKHKRFPYGRLKEEVILFEPEDFVIEVLEECEVNVDLLKKEEEWILRLDSINPEKGYNTTVPSKENMTYEKVLKRKESVKRSYSDRAPYGLKKMSEEEWLRRRNEDINFKVRSTNRSPEDLKKDVLIVNKETGNIIEEIKGIAVAASKYGEGLERAVQANKNGRWVISKNYLFCLKERYNKEEYLKHLKSLEKVPVRTVRPILITLENIKSGELLSFDCLKKCAESIGGVRKGLDRLRKGERKKGNKIERVKTYKGWRIHWMAPLGFKKHNEFRFRKERIIG